MKQPVTWQLPQKTELVILLTAMLALFAVVAVYSPYLVPWTDEVQFADPAYSMFFGKGFTSSAWPYQRPEEFFIGNAPLFPFLLYVWMSAVGTSIAVLHALNWLLAAGGCVLVWLAWRRSSPQIGSFVRIAMLLTMLCGYGVAFGYLNLRYDILGCFLFGLVFYASTLHGRLRETCLASGGFLILLAGFQLVVAASIAIAGFILLCRHPLRRWQSVLLGMTAGGVFWLSCVAWHGLLKKFLLVTFGSQHVLSGQLGKLVMQGDKIGIGRFLHPATLYLQDLSLLTMMACFVFGALQLGKKTGQSVVDSVLRRLFVLAVVLVPVGLYVIGKFPVYYTWIAYVPCCLLCGQVWQALLEKHGKKMAAALCVFCVGAASLGYVRNVAEIEHRGDPEFDKITAQIRPWLNQDDWVYSSFAFYFIVRPQVARVFVETYGQTRFVPGLPEKDRVSLLVVKQEELEQAMQLLGGHWQAVQTMPLPPAFGNNAMLVLARRQSRSN